MGPTWTDVAHFRAPYKNSWLSGFGAEVVPTGTEAVEATIYTVDKDGIRIARPEFQQGIATMLANTVVIHTPSDDSVVLAQRMPAGDPREITTAWIARKLAGGSSVAMACNAPTLAGLLVPVGGPIQHMLAAIPCGSASESKVAKAGAPTSGAPAIILARPGSCGFSIAGIGTGGLLLIGAVAIGGIWLLSRGA